MSSEEIKDLLRSIQNGKDAFNFKDKAESDILKLPPSDCDSKELFFHCYESGLISWNAKREAYFIGVKLTNEGVKFIKN